MPKKDTQPKSLDEWRAMIKEDPLLPSRLQHHDAGVDGVWIDKPAVNVVTVGFAKSPCDRFTLTFDGDDVTGISVRSKVPLTVDRFMELPWSMVLESAVKARELDAAAVSKALRNYRASMPKSGRAKGELLTAVREIRDAAIKAGRSPRQTVAGIFGVTERTANRWLAELDKP